MHDSAMNIRILILSVAIILLPGISSVYGQKIAVKANVLYGAALYTPNLGAEIGLGDRTTLDIAAGYNPWNREMKVGSDEKRAVHYIIQPEFRYWLCKKFNGHFFGAHALFSQYNVSGHELPLLFGDGSKNFRYEGYAYGIGLAYGYQFVLGKRWNLELSAGVGYARLDFDKFECQTCGDKIAKESRNYFGPTKAAISLIFIIK